MCTPSFLHPCVAQALSSYTYPCNVLLMKLMGLRALKRITVELLDKTQKGLHLMVISPTCCSKQGSPKLGEVDQALILSVWRISKDTDLTSSLVPVPDLHYYCRRIFFPYV